MSDNDDYEDDDNATANEPGWAKQLRKQNREFQRVIDEQKNQLAEAAQLKRESLFLKAGVDPEDAKNKYFFKGYDGEDSVDAIRAAATEAGFLAGEAQPTQQQQELATMQRISQASVGGQPVAPQLEQDLLNELGTKSGMMGQAEWLQYLQGKGVPVTYQ